MLPRKLFIPGGARQVAPAASGAPNAASRIDLREAGLIRTSKQGVQHRNVVREEDINARFPKLLKMILSFPD